MGWGRSQDLRISDPCEEAKIASVGEFSSILNCSNSIVCKRCRTAIIQQIFPDHQRFSLAGAVQDHIANSRGRVK